MKHRGRLAALAALLITGPAFSQQPMLTEWVENDPAQEPDKIGLGYPVPIPVDTVLDIQRMLGDGCVSRPARRLPQFRHFV